MPNNIERQGQDNSDGAPNSNCYYSVADGMYGDSILEPAVPDPGAAGRRCVRWASMALILGKRFGRGKQREVDYLARVDSSDEWGMLSARPGHHTVARTETVKFLIDLADKNRTYFVNTRKWETHFIFVQRYIDPRADYARFNVREYSREDRRFILGAIMHYLDGGHWTIELDGADTLIGERIAWLFDHVAERFWAASELCYRPVSIAQIARVESLNERLPMISRDAINAAIVYQPVVLGVAYGYLRLLPGPLALASLRPSDIVVTDQVPLEIPPIAALVTSELQAPLAHVAVLNRNRNTPDMALRGGIDAKQFQALEGKLVKLTVGAQDYLVESVALEEAEAAWSSIRPAIPFRPERDLQTRGLFDVEVLGPLAARYVGAKAAQLGEVGQIPGIQTPGGFAVSFAAYATHLQSAGLTNLIEAMLVEEAFRSDATYRAERLAWLRAAICSHPVDPTLLASLIREMRARSGRGPYIFRSSTNAEDMAAFNGAGLYESIIVPAACSEEQIAEALRVVWASVWLQRAFEEREWYRIDHEAVAMGVLVQPLLDEAAATGVAITGNVFNESLSGVFINVQKAGATVTGATGDEIPEQFLVTTWTGTYEPELLSRSSLTGGAAILSEAAVRQLTDQLVRIHDVMLPAHIDAANAMDVEFVLTKDGQFVIVQARPYSIVYDLDRKPPKRMIGRLAQAMYRLRRIIYRFAPRRTASL